MEYLFNPYDSEETKQIQAGDHPFVAPHCMYEAVHSPASVTGHEYHVRQMGTQNVVARFHTEEEAKEAAVKRAKKHTPHGLAFHRITERISCGACGRTVSETRAEFGKVAGEHLLLCSTCQYSQRNGELVDYLEQGEAYLDALRQVDRETGALIHALNGGFIEPSVGGDPMRNPDSLPTRRNLYGFDLRWDRVRELAEEAVALWPDLHSDLLAFASALDAMART
jgi:cobalamin biosynthesis Mg chelatase CobN